MSTINNNTNFVSSKYQAPVWGEALIPVTRIKVADNELVIIGDVEGNAIPFVELLKVAVQHFKAEEIFSLCGKYGVDTYIHDGEINIVWRNGKFGTPMIGDIIHLKETNPLKWGKYIGRLFNNVDHVVEGVSVQYMALDMALNDGGGIVSRSFLRRTYGQEYPEAVYYTYLGDGGLTKGLAVVGDTFGADFILPKDLKGVMVMGMDGVIAVSAGHCHTEVEIDNQSLQNIGALRTDLAGWLIQQFEELKKDMRKPIPAWMDGANVPSMVRKYARTLSASIIEDSTLRIKAPIIRGHYRPSFDLFGDEIRITISDRMYKGHPALVLIEYSAEIAGNNLARMGGGDYDDNALVRVSDKGQVVMWRQPNAPYEYVVGTLFNSNVPTTHIHPHVWEEDSVQHITTIPTVVHGNTPATLIEAYKIASASKSMIGVVVNNIALIKDIRGNYPTHIPSLEGIIGVQNKGNGQFTQDVHNWVKATGQWIESHSQFISEFYWGKYVAESKGEWKQGNYIPSFEDALLTLARKLSAEFMAWVERNVVPYALPPRQWVETTPYIDNKGVLGQRYGKLLAYSNGKDEIQRAINKYRIELQRDYRVFENMDALEMRLSQHTVLSLFEGNATWTATSSTKKEFGVSQIVKVAYNATPYHWGHRDFGFAIRFVAHNWAISRGKMVAQKPSDVTDTENVGILAPIKRDVESHVWVGESLSFNNGFVYYGEQCIGMADVPDGVYEGRISFAHYFAGRDVMWVVCSPISNNAIVPEGYWDEAYQMVEDTKEEIDWYIDAQRLYAPIIAQFDTIFG